VVVSMPRAMRVVVKHRLSCAAGPKQHRLRKVVIHAAQLLRLVSDSSRMLRPPVPTCVVVSPLRVEAIDVARFLPISAGCDGWETLQKDYNCQK
jgi:hypothetical protein